MRCHLYKGSPAGVNGIISCVAAEAAVLSATCYLLPPHYCSAGAGGSVNIINMAVISAVLELHEELTPGEMNESSLTTTLPLRLIVQ